MGDQSDSQPADSRPGTSPRYPDPPPFRALFLTGGPEGPIPSDVPKSVRKKFWGPLQASLEWYLDSVRTMGKAYPGWQLFERDLARQFAALLLLLVAAGREEPRRQMLELFLEGLNLENRPGRARKAKSALAEISHGRLMERLWEQEMLRAWNMKDSLEKQGKTPPHIRSRMRGSQIEEDIIGAVLSAKATTESALAKIYARRNHLSEGRARNALRAYRKFSAREFTTQV